MMSVLYWILFCKLLLICFQTGRANLSASANDQRFKRVECSNGGGSDILCKNIETRAEYDREEKESVWPPGPFVLPLSIYGCPESYQHGWREGYLSFTWGQSNQVYVTGNSDINRTDHMRKIKRSAWPNHQTVTLGPFHEFTFKFNFCYKQKRNVSLDKGVWPLGTYGVYADAKGCQEGFVETVQNISLPVIRSWASDGLIPDFRIIEQNNSATLQLWLCTRHDTQSSADGSSRPLLLLETPFVWLKTEERKCTILVDEIRDFVEETIFLEQETPKGLDRSLKLIQSFCYSIPNAWNTMKESLEDKFEKLFEKAYFMTPKIVKVGNTSIQANLEKNTQLASGDIPNFFQQLGNTVQDKLIIPWILIDLARSIHVSAVQVELVNGNLQTLECFISNEKLAFLHYAALSCSFVSKYNSYTGRTDILLKRVMTGRYISLVKEIDRNIIELDTADTMSNTDTVRVFTQSLYQSSALCNIFLGMTDGSIREDQLSVSSENSHYPVAGIRPYHAGWCASVHDPDPTVTVDLLTSLKVEGLVIWNWSERLMVQGEEAVIEKLYILGAQTLVIYHGNDMNDLQKYDTVFHFDKSHSYNEEQTILFKMPVTARFVQIRIIDTFTEDLNCLRFELIGCKSSDLFENPQLQKISPEHSMITVVNQLTEEAVINSIGIPSYIAGQTYSWIVKFTTFVKVIVTHMSLNIYELQDCKDKVKLSSDMFESTDHSRMIDNRFNGYEFEIETKEKQLIITFESCATLSKQLVCGSGFQAIVLEQDVAACFQLESDVDWTEGRREVCTRTTMMLTSMTFLGLPFRKTTEIWTIHVPSQRIHVHIIEFQVSCKTNEHKSEFRIIDSDFGDTYCNTKRPPDNISSASDTIVISFSKDTDPHIMYTEGFKATYTTTMLSVEADIDYETPHAKATNVARGKPSVMSSIYLQPASGANDGVIHQDTRLPTCFDTDLEFEPWWLVDLEAIYVLDRVVVYNRRDCKGCERRTENIEILVGLSLSSMKVTGYHCGVLKTIKIFPQFDIKGRYVQVQTRNKKTYMNICEIEVFGILDTKVEKRFNTGFKVPKPVNGNWGSWGEWSVVCNNKEQRRTRLCNDPRPNFHGNFCEGNDTSYRLCTPTNTFQENILTDKPFTLSSRDIINYSCYQTIKEDYPWIMVDLLNQYHLDRMSVSNHMDVTNVVILAGQTLCSMKEHYFTDCGGEMANPVDLTGVTARFIKLQIIEEAKALYLCDLKLSGELDFDNNTMGNECETGINLLNILTNSGMNSSKEWSSWSNCSSVCGIGTQFRSRPCSNNISDSSGASCQRLDTDYQTCKNYESCFVCSNKYNKCYNIVPELTNWRHAGNECWRRQMKLVSIHSIDELRFIKQLLRRQTKYTADRPSVVIQSIAGNMSYFTHIGVYRVQKTNQGVADYSEDYKPVIFTAWKLGEPSNGSCTRMNFQFYNQDNTWESEDCETGLAEYFICETVFEKYRKDGVAEALFSKYSKDWHMFPDQQIKTTEYSGTVNFTDVKTYCLPWANQTKKSNKQSIWWQKYFQNGKDTSTDEEDMYTARDFPEGSSALTSNYCRDPENEGYLWCYTGDTYSTCTFALPALSNFEPRYRYRGKQNTTYSGKTCQRWDTDYPHAHELIEYDYKGEPLKTKENYCRDPWDTGYLWCFTTDIDTRWEPCIVKDATSGRCSRVIGRYNGSLNVTFSGKACKMWNSFMEGTENGLSNTVTENYCRDPLDEGFLWCYTDIVDKKREPCFIFNQNVQIDDFIGTTAMYTCNNGDQISWDFVCNRKIDCVDLSDELECWKNYDKHMLLSDIAVEISHGNRLKSDSYFHCGSLEWISLLAHCDTVIDCLDASDEKGCSYLISGHNNCSIDEFRCNAGDCIHISQVCDFIVDCTDASDEYCDLDFCETYEYKCGSGQCIPEENRCDAYVHCLDGSDEQFCSTCNEDKAFHCDIVRCIPKRLVCDKYTDCVDRSDENLCMEPTFSSCIQWWNAGFRESGPYIIDGIAAQCNFESILTDGVIYTVFKNMDIVWYNETKTGNMYVREDKRESDPKYIERFTTANCSQEIKQSCFHARSSKEYFHEERNGNISGHCNCSVQIVTGPSYTTNQTCSGEFSDGRELVFTYELSGYFRTVKLLPSHTNNYQIEVGNLTCATEYNHTDDVLICKNDVKIIPNVLRCVYDTDAAGFITGCRSQSHLQNCETFSCPSSTVKCPGSYCIPTRFICDGQMQCPGGEDEDMCGCNTTNSEIQILVYQQFYASHKTIVNNFAKQFYNHNSIVRILIYETKRPLVAFSLDKIQLQIHDKQLQPYDVVNRVEECEYKIMAEHFIHFTRFSEKGLKGIIFLDTDEETATVANEIFGSIITSTNKFLIYRIKEMPYISKNVVDKFPGVMDVRVTRWKTLTAIGAEYFSKLCTVNSAVHIPNNFKCSSSKTFILRYHVCDGVAHCLHRDDERLCSFVCPTACKCKGFSVDCSNSSFNMHKIKDIDQDTRVLDLSLNKALYNITENAYLNIRTLIRLNLSHCDIENISHFAFHNVRHLLTLDLSFNVVKILRTSTFHFLINLSELNLKGNTELAVIESRAFSGLKRIHVLNLDSGKYRKISANTFSGLSLEYLDLSSGKIDYIDPLAFNDLSVETIDFRNNNIRNLHQELFKGVVNLKKLRTPAYKFCCVRPNYMKEEDCYPTKDEFSSCEDLMRLPALQTMLWFIGMTAFFGNLLSIIYRLRYDKERLRFGFGIFVTNLAAADFLMSVYLLIIAVADSAFRNGYIFVDDYWRNSAWCKLAGILSTISSEASILFICLITIDRLFVVKYPFGEIRFSTMKASLAAAFAWVFSVVVAIVPVVYVSYFQDKFYSRSGVCIALPLTRDRPPGWMYSVAIFVGLNFATFVLVAFGQWLIISEIRRTNGRSARRKRRKEDLKVTRNLLLVVATDFLCWFPIGVMGMMALRGHVISGDVYAWSAVFLLPVNSALNPVLYTLTSILGKRKFAPSVDEQSRIDATSETGLRGLEMYKIGRYFHDLERKTGEFMSIRTILEREIILTLKSILTICIGLVECMDTLHSGAMVIGNLSEDKVLVYVKKQRIIGDVRLRGQPWPRESREDIDDDICQMGNLIHTLLNIKTRITTRK